MVCGVILSAHEIRLENEIEHWAAAGESETVHHWAEGPKPQHPRVYRGTPFHSTPGSLQNDRQKSAVKTLTFPRDKLELSSHTHVPKMLL